jgi:CBS domain-containing protein
MQKRKTVAEVMTSEVVTVGPATPFKEIAKILTEREIRAVPVVDDSAVLGLVSEADLLHKEEYRAEPRLPWYRRMWRRSDATKAEATRAAELMTSPPVTIRPDALIVEAARMMAQHGVTRLVVVDETGRLAGIVSRGDLLDVFLRSDEEIRAATLNELVPYAIWTDPHEIDVTVRDGVVTLSGRVERKSYVPIALSLAWGIDGVVDVIDKLSYVYVHAPPTIPSGLKI